jgi:predicted RecB family endonuclease
VKPRVPETAVAAPIVAWLQAQHWDVYQEVTCRGSVCDIVATRGPIVWAIECKASLGVDVIAQAYSWRRMANYVSVATPRRRRSDARECFERDILQRFDIGALSMECVYGSVREEIAPVLYRRVDSSLRERLCDAQKTFAPAGNADGRRWTPFQETCAELRRFVQERPGCSLKEAIGSISHHYASPASARAAMRIWIEKGVVDGVAARREGRTIKLYATAGGAR